MKGFVSAVSFLPFFLPPTMGMEPDSTGSSPFDAVYGIDMSCR